MKSCYLLFLSGLMFVLPSCTTSFSDQYPPGTILVPPQSSALEKSDVSSKTLRPTVEQLRLLKVVAGDYRLGGGDVVSLWGDDIVGLNRSFVLGPDGKVTIPEVGVLSFEGLTREEAMKMIEASLKKNYQDPKVSLLIESYNNNRVSVLGEVRSPGEYSFAANPSLLNVLAKAGGPSATADLRSCTVVRGRNVIIQIDLRELLGKGNLSLNIPLLPNDSVYIRAQPLEQANVESTFFVLGEVQRPGLFSLGAGTSLVDPVRAISLAGGDTRDAKLSGVRIVRRNATGSPTVLKVNLDNLLAGRRTDMPAIAPGDIVFVPRKGVATFRYYIDQVVPALNAILVGYAVDDLLNGDD